MEKYIGQCVTENIPYIKQNNTLFLIVLKLVFIVALKKILVTS